MFTRGGVVARSVVASALVVLSIAAPASAGEMISDSPTASGERGSAISDGKEAPAKSWAAIQFLDGKRFCSASLVAPEWVMTATHCVKGDHQGMSFRVGSNKVDNGGSVYNATAVHKAPGFDITLVKITPPAKETPVRLADNPPAMNSPITIYGWGATGTGGGGPQSPTLKMAAVKYYADGKDNSGGAALRLSRVDGMAQPGDSGGPAVFGEDLQVGVASTSNLKDSCTYGSVAAARSWIRQVTGR